MGKNKNKIEQIEEGSAWLSRPKRSYGTSRRPDVSTMGSLAPLQGRGGCPVSRPLTPKQVSRWQGGEQSVRKELTHAQTHTHPISLPLAQLARGKSPPAAPPPHQCRHPAPERMWGWRHGKELGTFAVLVLGAPRGAVRGAAHLDFLIEIRLGVRAALLPFAGGELRDGGLLSGRKQCCRRRAALRHRPCPWQHLHLLFVFSSATSSSSSLPGRQGARSGADAVPMDHLLLRLRSGAPHCFGQIRHPLAN